MAHVIKVERATKDGKKRHAWKVRYRDPDRVERARTFTKKTDAENFASSIETDILRGDYVDPRAGKVSLDTWAEKWAAGLSVKPKTKAGYESLLRSRILPTFGKRRLAQIRRSDIQEWLASMLAEGLSPGRVRQAVIVLRLMLDAAVDDRLIARNPADRIKLPKIPHKEAEYFDPEVADRIVSAVPEEYRLLFRILAILGLRYGEAVALRRRHVDFLRRRLRVEESLAEVSGQLIFGPTKSHAERALPIPPSLMAELEQHLETIDADPETLLFTGEKGGPLRYRYAYMDIWRPVLKELGMPTVGM
ncbi:MAG: tyrosine-type recombinase/integrase, partial [Actinomycetota bacterium]